MAILIIATAFFLKGIGQLETENTQDSELPDDNPTVQTKKKIESIFGKKDIILIGLESDSIFTYKTLSAIRDIEEEIRSLESVIPDETVSIVSVNNIRGVEDGVEVGEYIKEIPTDPEELQELKKYAVNNDLMVNRIISEDGRYTSIVANVEEGYSEEYLYNKVTEIIDKYKDTGYFFISGDPIQQKEIDLGIQGDMRLLLPIALLLLIVAYFISFRTFLGVMLPLTIVLLSIIWTMGSIHYLGYKITVVSSIIAILMLVISGSYGIHVMQKVYDEYDSVNKNVGEIRTKVVNLMFRPFFLTSITSSLGMITLIIFKVRSIKEFGVIVSCGSFFTFVITILLTSSLLWFLRNKKLRLSRSTKGGFLSKMLAKLGTISLSKQKTIIIVSLLVLGISIFGVFKIKIGNNFIEYFPKDHKLTIAYEKFNENLGGADYIDIMFAGKTPDAVKNPGFLVEMENMLEYTKKTYPYVGSTFSVIDIIKRMNKELHSGDSEYYRIPDNSDEIAQYLLLYSMSGNPGDFSSLIDYDNQRTKVRIMLTSSEQDKHREIHEGMRAYAAQNCSHSDVEFGGGAIFWLAQIDYIVIGKIQNIISAILIVLLSCIIVFRSFKYGIVSIIPLTLASFFTFGVMGILGIRLETATALITSIGISIGVDFAIHYIFALRRELSKGKSLDEAVSYVMGTTGRAIFLDAFTTILGFVVFIFSGFVPIQHFGWLITLTMISACISSLLMFPTIIKLFKLK